MELIIIGIAILIGLIILAKIFLPLLKHIIIGVIIGGITGGILYFFFNLSKNTVFIISVTVLVCYLIFGALKVR